ncbi:hypothetical protein [Methyloglobulus sp.]|uniref:hypothetical protein n=1 Tax=Methyloglobulus sp. TaxID=2518622 RepID=UPI003988B3C3
MTRQIYDDFLLNPKQSPHFLAEQNAATDKRDGKKQHGPDAQGGSDVQAGADKLEVSPGEIPNKPRYCKN